MSDYTELVKTLRELSVKNSLSFWKRGVCKDAAAAIEELQAEQKKTVTQIFCEEQMAWEGRCKDLMKHISDLQAEVKRLELDNEDYEYTLRERYDEPKRGKWEREMDVNDEPFYQCSVCGECFDFNRDSTHEVFKYCPDCGAKMEVQDGQ